MPHWPHPRSGLIRPHHALGSMICSSFYRADSPLPAKRASRPFLHPRQPIHANPILRIPVSAVGSQVLEHKGHAGCTDPRRDGSTCVTGGQINLRRWRRRNLQQDKIKGINLAWRGCYAFPVCRTVSSALASARNERAPRLTPWLVESKPANRVRQVCSKVSIDAA
jgi:hypothetical protein